MTAIVNRNASESKIEVSSIAEMRTAADAFREAGKSFEITGYNDSRVVYWCNWSPQSHNVRGGIV